MPNGGGGGGGNRNHHHHDRDILWWRLPEEKRPQFFKIIHSGIIRDEQLVIPPLFVRKIGTDLTSDVAFLKVPTGDIWEVELGKENGGISFQNGLKEFIDHHSIFPGHFLVFRYDGNSQFYVLIFDLTGSEIDYDLCNSYHSDKEANHNTESSETEADEIDVHYSETSEPDDSSSEPEPETDSDSDSDSEDEEGERIGELIDEKLANKKAYVTKSIPVTTQDKATQRVREFKTKFSSFTVTLKPAYLKHEYLPIPSTFDNEYLLEDVESVRLKVPDGRSWLVRLICSGKKEMKLSKGLSEFMDSNALEAGDVCVFEVIKKRYLVLRVHIFRKVDVDDMSSSSNSED